MMTHVEVAGQVQGWVLLVLNWGVPALAVVLAVLVLFTRGGENPERPDPRP